MHCIIARCDDGVVYHARMDFQPLDIMSKLVCNGIFTKGEKRFFARSLPGTLGHWSAYGAGRLHR